MWTGEEAVVRGSLLRLGVWAIVVSAVVYLAFRFGVRSLFVAPEKHGEPPSQYGIALKYNVTME